MKQGEPTKSSNCTVHILKILGYLTLIIVNGMPCFEHEVRCHLFISIDYLRTDWSFIEPLRFNRMSEDSSERKILKSNHLYIKENCEQSYNPTICAILNSIASVGRSFEEGRYPSPSRYHFFWVVRNGILLLTKVKCLLHDNTGCGNIIFFF